MRIFLLFLATCSVLEACYLIFLYFWDMKKDKFYNKYFSRTLGILILLLLNIFFLITDQKIPSFYYYVFSYELLIYHKFLFNKIKK